MTPAATGAAKTRTFLIHCCGRSERTMPRRSRIGQRADTIRHIGPGSSRITAKT